MVRIVVGHRVVIHGSILVELFGLITCVEEGTRPGNQTARPRAECA